MGSVKPASMSWQPDDKRQNSKRPLPCQRSTAIQPLMQNSKNPAVKMTFYAYTIHYYGISIKEGGMRWLCKYHTSCKPYNSRMKGSTYKHHALFHERPQESCLHPDHVAASFNFKATGQAGPQVAVLTANRLPNWLYWSW